VNDFSDEVIVNFSVNIIILLVVKIFEINYLNLELIAAFYLFFQTKEHCSQYYNKVCGVIFVTTF